MLRWPRWSLALLPLSITACGGPNASTSSAGTGGAAGGSTGAVISTSSVKSFAFHAVGENTPGFTSADTGTRLYVDESIPEGHEACP